jgi:hypothetical protein
MSVLPSEEPNIAIGGSTDIIEPLPSPKAGLKGAMFVTVAGAAMAGWLYLIAKLVWACVAWLLS